MKPSGFGISALTKNNYNLSKHSKSRGPRCLTHPNSPAYSTSIQTTQLSGVTVEFKFSVSVEIKE